MRNIGIVLWVFGMASSSSVAVVWLIYQNQVGLAVLVMLGSLMHTIGAELIRRDAEDQVALRFAQSLLSGAIKGLSDDKDAR